MRGFIVLLLLTAWLTSCSSPSSGMGGGSHTIIDWVNVIKFNGITYQSMYLKLGRTISEEDLGKEYARIQFKLEGNVQDASYQLKDGDAAFLDAGTPVFTVKGYKPEFRLAAYIDGKLSLYESDTYPKAKTGADLLDLVGKVQYIGVNSAEDGVTELAAIKDPATVTALVDKVLGAPVDNAANNPSTTNMFIVFHLKDGTAVVRMYGMGSNVLSRNIQLPDDFEQAIVHALKPTEGEVEEEGGGGGIEQDR